VKRLLPLFVLLAASACQPRYDGLEVTLYSNPPLPVRVSGLEFELPVGIAAAIDVEPQSSARFNYYSDDPLTLRSQDRGVLRVEATEHPRRFVLVAVSAGTTCVDIEVLHENQGCIPATVLAAPR